MIDGGIDATHPAFIKRSTPDPEEYLKGKSQIPNEDLAARSRVVATYDLTLVRDIMASGGDPQSASERTRPIIKRLAADPEQRKAFKHMAVRDQDARDLDWQIVLPLVQVPHDAGYIQPGTDHGTHVAGIIAADWREPADIDSPADRHVPRPFAL